MGSYGEGSLARSARYFNQAMPIQRHFRFARDEEQPA
jgi:hypothetical protein